MRKKIFIKNIEAKIKSISVFVMLVLVTLTAMFIFNPFISVSADYTDFDYYKDITINSSMIDSTLTNFPVLINLTDTSLRDNVIHTDGYDIAFFDDTGTTQYHHEIEHWDGSTGRLSAWVNITSLAHDSDTTIRMSYGNNDGVDYQNITNVWDDDVYIMVHHFNGSSATDIDDSTANNLDVASDNGDPTYNQDGRIGRGVDLDGAGDELLISDNSLLSFGDGASNDDEFSIVWYGNVHDVSELIIVGRIQDSPYTQREYVFSTTPAGVLRLYLLDYDNNNRVYAVTNSAISTGYRHFAVTYGGNGAYPGGCVDDMEIYIDGSSAAHTCGGSGTYNAMHDLNFDTSIGWVATWGEGSDAVFEELWVCYGELSANYLDAQYNNWNFAEEGGFYTLGAPTSASGTYNIDGLNEDTRFTHAGQAGVTNTSTIVMKVYTNTSGTTDSCSEIFLDFSGGYPSGFVAGNFSFQVRNTTDGTFANDWCTVTGNMSLNSSTWTNSWAYGTDPFPITNYNSTIEVKMRVAIPSAVSPGTYTTDAWKTVWKIEPP
jgi:hypothetical protein